MKEKIENRELQKSMRLVILGITFGMAFFPVVGNLAGTPIFTGYIRYLGANDFIFSLIMALPVLGGIMQVLGAYLLEITGKRKPLFLIAGFIHRLAFIPIAVVPLLFTEEFRHTSVWVIAAIVTISSMASSLVSISFMSWMGDLIPEDIKGSFFSKRTMISTIMSLFASLIAGYLIDSISGLKGFAIIISIAAIFGVLDITCFFRVKEPKMSLNAEGISLMKIVTMPFKNKNYMNFVIFNCLWMFGLNIATPFFNVYMIENLGMKYFTVFLLGPVLSNFMTILFIRRWGGLADKFGSKLVIKICTSIIFLLPFAWLFVTPANFVPIIIGNSLSGIFWPGYDMSQLNLTIWLAPNKNRSIYIANHSLFIALFGTAIPYVIGGGVMTGLKAMLSAMAPVYFLGQELNAFHLLFILSGLIRLSAVIFLLPKFTEHGRPPVNESIRVIKKYISAYLKHNIKLVKYKIKRKGV